MVLFENIYVQAEGLTPFQRYICNGLFTLVEPPIRPKAKVTVETLVSGVMRCSGIACHTIAQMEHNVFEKLGLNHNITTRILFYGVVVYTGKQVFERVSRPLVQRVFGYFHGKVIGWKNQLALKWKAPKMRVGAILNTHMIAESARPGSIEQPMMPKPFQAPVGYMDGTEFVAMGWTIRMHSYLVIPEHVVAAVLAIVPGTKIWLKSNTRVHEVDMKYAVYPDTDLVLVKCTEQEFSLFGLPKVNIEHVISENTGETVSISGLDMKGTTGVLRHAAMFGMVVYDSTTKNGYSGSPYVKGTRVLGIHLCGGKINAGYSASYINMLINKIDRIIVEDSEDFIQHIVKRKGKKAFRIVNISGGQDEIQVRIDGRYHTFETDTMQRVLGTGWMETLDFDTPEIRQRYADAGYLGESASGSLGFYGASTTSSNAISLPTAPVVNQTQQLPMSSMPSKKELKIQRRVQTQVDAALKAHGLKH